MPVNRVKNMTIHEILTKASAGKTKEDVIKVLRDYNCLALRDILKIAYDDTVKFYLPEGAPPYKESSSESPPSSLRKQNKKFKYFVREETSRIRKVKMEKMFVSLLESIDPNDAKIVVWAKDKKLSGKYKGVNKTLVKEAFPGLIKE